MKKVLIMFLILLMPIIVSAEVDEDGLEIVSSTTKYYKTVVTDIDDNGNVESYSVEVSEEEYNNSDLMMTRGSSQIETGYKRMTTSIIKNGSYYRYKNVLFWKQIPATRSYDIMGIGYSAAVVPKSQSVFSQEYCVNSTSNCTTSTTINDRQSFNNGVGVSFKIPTGNVVHMVQTFYVDMKKSSSSSTITSQTIVGDYSHAQSSVTSTQARNYTITMNGVVLDSSISSHYDNINFTRVTWTGTW